MTQRGRPKVVLQKNTVKRETGAVFQVDRGEVDLLVEVLLALVESYFLNSYFLNKDIWNYTLFFPTMSVLSRYRLNKSTFLVYWIFLISLLFFQYWCLGCDFPFLLFDGFFMICDFRGLLPQGKEGSLACTISYLLAFIDPCFNYLTCWLSFVWCIFFANLNAKGKVVHCKLL